MLHTLKCNSVLCQYTSGYWTSRTHSSLPSLHSPPNFSSLQAKVSVSASPAKLHFVTVLLATAKQQLLVMDGHAVSAEHLRLIKLRISSVKRKSTLNFSAVDFFHSRREDVIAFLTQDPRTVKL
jgi:hypothetical protein